MMIGTKMIKPRKWSPLYDPSYSSDSSMSWSGLASTHPCSTCLSQQSPAFCHTCHLHPSHSKLWSKATKSMQILLTPLLKPTQALAQTRLKCQQPSLITSGHSPRLLTCLQSAAKHVSVCFCFLSYHHHVGLLCPWYKLFSSMPSKQYLT